MQVVAAPLVAEHVGPLVEAFAARDDGLEVAVEAVPGAAFGDLLEHRRADIALGPHPGPERSAAIAAAPFLRCRLIVVAAPGHPLAAARAIAPAALASERWLVGEPELDPMTSTGLFFARNALAPRAVATYSSQAAAIAAAAAGEGIA